MPLLYCSLSKVFVKVLTKELYKMKLNASFIRLSKTTACIVAAFRLKNAIVVVKQLKSPSIG